MTNSASSDHPYPLLTQEGKRILWLPEVVDDERYFFGGVPLGVSCHAAGPEGGVQLRTATNPEVQVTQRPADGLRFGEVEHGQFGLPVGTDFEFFQMSGFWVKQIIDDVDLRRLLLWRGILFEQRADVDRIESMA